MVILSSMTKRIGKRKRKPGPKPKKYSAAVIKKMEDLAFSGCQNNTIATLLDIPMMMLQDRPELLKLLTKKRCERKLWLRQTQDEHAESNHGMAIFLGKNELGQADKQEIEHSGNIILEPPKIG